jgi:hypothetical protein
MPPATPTTAFVASSAVRRPRSCICAWSITEADTGRSRSLRPSDDAVGTGSSSASARSAVGAPRTTTGSSTGAADVLCACACSVQARRPRRPP